MHRAKLTGVQVLLPALQNMPIDWLILYWGALIVTIDKGLAIYISYSDARSLVAFIWGFTESVFLFLLMIQKRKTLGTPIYSFFHALSITNRTMDQLLMYYKNVFLGQYGKVLQHIPIVRMGSPTLTFWVPNKKFNFSFNYYLVQSGPTKSWCTRTCIGVYFVGTNAAVLAQVI
jgi:hypothetical protein